MNILIASMDSGSKKSVFNVTAIIVKFQKLYGRWLIDNITELFITPTRGGLSPIVNCHWAPSRYGTNHGLPYLAKTIAVSYCSPLSQGNKCNPLSKVCWQAISFSGLFMFTERKHSA
ncbi:MAG: hypothetical protein L7F77_14610, partial [Candidatus Magnetominusculus sp. LBB02]|nr:hypothetical protein [Candidatus Magnetominusculus sp. LBB02]